LKGSTITAERTSTTYFETRAGGRLKASPGSRIKLNFRHGFTIDAAVRGRGLRPIARRVARTDERF
jgi:hypothetical protein